VLLNVLFILIPYFSIFFFYNIQYTITKIVCQEFIEKIIDIITTDGYNVFLRGAGGGSPLPQ